MANGATAFIEGEEQMSGVSVNDLRNTSTFSVKSANGCFSSNWNIHVLITKLDIELLELSDPLSIIPNIITPNGDSYNERFEIGELFQGSEVAIYNRHGLKVYENKHYKNEFSGSALSSGQYYYSIISNCYEKPIKGYLHILK